MDRIMNSWLDLQSKRGMNKMESLFAFVSTPSQHYKVRIYYERDPSRLYMEPEVEDIRHPCIHLDKYSVAALEDEGGRIKVELVEPYEDLPFFHLEFTNEVMKNMVHRYLRKVRRDKNFDSGHSTQPSPPVE